MTEQENAPRRGRRARALSPEEQAALEARAAKDAPGAPATVPGMRGAVAAPTADAPVPSLRKFGRRARIIELSELPEPQLEPQSHPESQAHPEPRSDDGADGSAGTPVPAAEDTSIATIERDHDGVELGELSVTEAPEPKHAPRFEGKVLHRPESSRGRLLPMILWILIAIVLVVLVALLLTGVLGSGDASALSAALYDLSTDQLVLEEPAA